VTDEEGRRRQGGFSAGFYNTVGSKEGFFMNYQLFCRYFYLSALKMTFYFFITLLTYMPLYTGWAPRTFMSSRKKRAEVKGQTVYSFLDDDEKAVC
jgi:G patch domain-containing protein 1